MHYTSITKGEKLGGDKYPFQHLRDAKGAILQLGLWMQEAGTLEKVVCGGFNQPHDATAAILLRIVELQQATGSRVLLRIGYEFDNPGHKCQDPELFKAAWIRIAVMLRDLQGSESCIGNEVGLVWHSYASENTVADDFSFKADRWWPGDKYVDWVAMSVFGQGFKPIHNTNGPCGMVADFAKKRGKPLMIAESTPRGWHRCEDISHEIGHFVRWLDNFLEFIDRRDVKIFSYICDNWDDADVLPKRAKQGWGDARLHGDSKEHVERLWRAEVVDLMRHHKPGI
jgi:hypothetical protein